MTSRSGIRLESAFHQIAEELDSSFRWNDEQKVFHLSLG